LVEKRKGERGGASFSPACPWSILEGEKGVVPFSLGGKEKRPLILPRRRKRGEGKRK